MRCILLAAILAGSLSHNVVIANEISRSAGTVDADQEIKCRRVEVTGSLVKKGKVCKTIAEWKRIIDNGNRAARAVYDQGARPTNGTVTEP